jgi:hypothetical protein
MSGRVRLPRLPHSRAQRRRRRKVVDNAGLYAAGVAILVDPASWPFHDRLWAHLVSDTSYDELHAFADRLGIPRRHFQGDHYDIPAPLRERAIALGALPVTGRELISRLIAAGLRRPRRPHPPAVPDPASPAPFIPGPVTPAPPR